MKTACAMLGLAFVLASQARAEDKTVTTITRSPHGTVVITQSGDPASATTTIERKKDSTVITRKSGGNSSTVIQGGDVGGDLPDNLMTPQMRRMLQLLQK